MKAGVHKTAFLFNTGQPDFSGTTLLVDAEQADISGTASLADTGQTDFSGMTLLVEEEQADISRAALFADSVGVGGRAGTQTSIMWCRVTKQAGYNPSSN